jgi:16S rRNA (guanine527-N7)-methyltransferase
VSIEIILKYFPDLTQKQIRQFSAMPELYSEWNAKINVISRKDIGNLLVNHVLHSMAIAKVIWFKEGTKILDVGTGGGFPGIPLAILFPKTDFHLVDSIGKKITVVNEIANALDLKNVQAEKARAEELSPAKEKYDFVVSRAVAPVKELYEWSSRLVRRKSINEINNGMLFLKGGDLEEELSALGKLATVYPISGFFKEEFFETKKVVFLTI